MKKLMVYLDEDVHEDLKTLSFRKKTPMAALVRYALDKTFENELDAIAAERALEEAASNPEEMVTLEEYMEKRGLRVPSRANTPRSPRSRKVAESSRRYSSGADGEARR